MTEPSRPRGSNADEWQLFLCHHLDNRATSLNGLTFMAVQIAEAIEDGRREERARIVAQLMHEGDVTQNAEDATVYRDAARLVQA